jgi:WD40 repeat protein
LVTHEADRSFVPHPALLRDAQTLQPAGPPLLHTDSIVSSGFASDGTRLATGGQDARVRIWSVPAGESLVPPMPHEGVVMGVRFTRDGRILATATRLGAVRLWDAHTGQPLNPSYTVTGGVAAMTFVRGNGPFVVVGGDGSIHRWDLTPSAHSVAELELLVQELNGGRR